MEVFEYPTQQQALEQYVHSFPHQRSRSCSSSPPDASLPANVTISANFFFYISKEEKSLQKLL